MWRRELTRLVLALNWCLAGWACGMVVYGHGREWHSDCLQVAYDDMVAEGVKYPHDRAHSDEWYRRGYAVRARLAPLERFCYFGWVLAMFGGAGTAIGLMIAFPKPVAAGGGKHNELSSGLPGQVTESPQT